MKSSFGLLLLLFLFSCNDSKPKEEPRDTVTNTTRPPLIKQDVPNPFAPVDLSPMDISYFPTDFPILRMSENPPAQPKVRVIYSRPHRQGRTIFGELLQYGEPWRLGANESTEIEFFQNARIQNTTVPKGRYVIYCIPEENQWTIVFNTNIYSWGLKQDASKDKFRFTIPVEKTPYTVDYFTIIFEPLIDGANLVTAWENLQGRLPIQF